MAKKKPLKKTAKKRAEKYDPKLKVGAKFIDILNAAVAPDKKK